MKTKRFASLLLTLIATLLVGGTAGHATSITANITTDDAFDLYVSTNDSVAGTYVGSGAGWNTTFTYNFNLTSNVTNYIHVYGYDIGQYIASFIGDFNLSDTSFKFANGSQYLVTDTANWQVYSGGFGGTPGVVTSQGANGVGPWFPLPSIGSNAEWIWTHNGAWTDSPRYFSTAVNPVVPVPSTALLLGPALVALGLWRRKSH